MNYILVLILNTALVGDQMPVLEFHNLFNSEKACTTAGNALLGPQVKTFKCLPKG